MYYAELSTYHNVRYQESFIKIQKSPMKFYNFKFI